MRKLTSLFAATVLVFSGCGAEMKPPPGAEQSATDLKVDIGGDDAGQADQPASPPAKAPAAKTDSP